MMAKCDVPWYFLNLSVVFVCNFAGVMAQEEASCYGSGSIALSVILTLIIGALLAVILFVVWKKFIKPKKGQHLILETDPEKGKGEYAFDNPGFKDAGLTPVGKVLEKNKVDSGNKTKWNQWSPLGVLTLKNEKKRTLDDSAIQDLHKIVTLRSHDFTGLGFNICGNMKEGIFIKDILHRGPAFESGKLNPGDRINSVTISFEHMVYEDALAILSYASPYEVIISAKSGKAINYPGQAGRPGHPIFRSSSTVDLSHVEKSSKKRLFQPDDSSEIGSNYSSLQKTRSNATTLERTRSKSPKPNQKLIKPKNKLNHDQLKLQLEQNIVEDYKETLRMKNDLEAPQKTETEHQKTENKHHKFGIQVLPMENWEQRSPKSTELSQNDNNINLEKSETVIPVASIDEVDKKVAPPVKKREKINKQPEIDTFTREDPLNGSGIKRDVNNIPLEIPNNMLYAAMAARKNRKSVEEEDVKSPKKLKGKAPAPPGLDDEANKFDEIYPVEENDNKLLMTSKNLNKSDDSIEKIAKTDYNSDSDIETDNQSSVNTIELNASDITVHQSEENEEKQNRKTASTGDLTKIQKTRKTSTGTLERAQSLDITDTTIPALAAKKRKAGKIEDNFDSKSSSDDSLYGNALINKEPRLSLILDGLNTFQRSRLKKSTEWGNMEDAILNLKQDGSTESVGRRSIGSYEDVKLSSENLALSFDAKLPEFDALVNKIKEIKEESVKGDVKQVKNEIWPFADSTNAPEIDIKTHQQGRDYVAINAGQDYTIKANHLILDGVKVNNREGYAITINKPDEIRRSEDLHLEMRNSEEGTRSGLKNQRSDDFGINKIEVENKRGTNFEINIPEDLKFEINQPEVVRRRDKLGINTPEVEKKEPKQLEMEINLPKVENKKGEKFEIKFDDSKDFQETENIVQTKLNISERYEIKFDEPETDVRNKTHTFEIGDDVELEIRPKTRIEPQIKLKPEPPKRFHPTSDEPNNIQIHEIRTNKPELNDVRLNASNRVEEIRINTGEIRDYVGAELPDVKMRTSKTILNEKTNQISEADISKTILNENSMDITIKKFDVNEKVVITKPDLNEKFVISKPDVNEKVVITKPERFVENKTSKEEGVVGINPSKPDRFVDINTSKSDRFVDIKSKKPERVVETKIIKPESFMEIQTNRLESNVEIITEKPERFVGMQIDTPEGFVDNFDKHDRVAGIKISKPERLVEIKSGKSESFVEIQTNRSESTLEINVEKTDRLAGTKSYADINTNKPDSLVGIKTGKPENFVEIKTNRPESGVEINTQKPNRLVGMKINSQKPDPSKPEIPEFKTNKPDDAMAKPIKTERVQISQPETISVHAKDEKSHHKPTIKHKIVKPEMSQVNSFILAERDATNENLQPATVKPDDTNVSDDMKVSRHSLGSLERAKTEKSDNVSNITIPSFEVKTKNVAESVKNFENIIVSTPDLIKNITIAEAIHDLNNEVTIEGPSSLTLEISGNEMLEGQEEFKGRNGIKMKSNGDINKLEVSGEENNSNSLTYITEIQVLTPKNVSEIEIIPKTEQVMMEKSIRKNLDNDFESYIKNFESNIKNFETNIQSFEQNIQDVAETAKKEVSVNTKSSITVNEKVDAVKELQKVQEIVEEQLKKLPEMRFTTSSYESQIKPPEKRQSQIEILRSNFEKSTSPPRLGKSEPSPPKSRIPVFNKTPPTSPERRDSKILDTEPDKEILEIMSSQIPMTSSLKYQPKTPTRNVTVTSIRSNSKIPSGLPTFNSRPPVPPRKTENEDLVQVSTNGNDSSFRQWVFNPSDAAVTNITVTEAKYERK